MTEPDWAGLRDAIAHQLAETGASQSEVAARTGLSRETIRPILNGVPGNYRTATLAKVSLALGWTGGSIQQVLNGGEPQTAAAAMEERLSAVEAEVAEIRQILARVEQGIEGLAP